MATFLRNLRIKKVDFVDAGANPKAHVKIVKNKDGNSDTEESAIKKVLSAIAKVLGIKQEDIDTVADSITKGDDVVTFNDQMYEVRRRKIADEIWDICYALQYSLSSIIVDKELDQTKKNELLQQSISEFNSVISESVGKWCEDKEAHIRKVDSVEITPEEAEIMKSHGEALIDMANQVIQKNVSPEGKEGENEEMKIDKSKMTPAERMVLEDIEKRYGANEEPTTQIKTESIFSQEEIVKSITAEVIKNLSGGLDTVIPQTNPQITQKQGGQPKDDDIYKGLNPIVAEELKALKKRAEEAEEKELVELAKRYAILGRKEEELLPVFKSLKAAGDDSFNEYIAILDQSVEVVEKSAMFGEIGKSGHGTTSDAWSSIEKCADEIMKSAPTMTRVQAIDAACAQNPELVYQYEQEK